MYDNLNTASEEIPSPAYNDPWRRSKRAKLDVAGTVIRFFHQKGVTPIGVVGHRAARKIVIEGYRMQRIAAMVKHR
jgi:hypothetical protein